MLNKSIVENIKNNSDWKALQEHIVTEADKLLTISDIDFSDKEKSAIIGQGRQEARKTLLRILEPFFGSEQPVTNRADETEKKTGLN